MNKNQKHFLIKKIYKSSFKMVGLNPQESMKQFYGVIYINNTKYGNKYQNTLEEISFLNNLKMNVMFH